MAHGLMILRNGHLVATGNPTTLYQTPTDAYTARLLARSNVLNPLEALELGIHTGSSIAIHPEWITLSLQTEGAFCVQDTRFRGFYEELVVGDGKVEVRVINHDIGSWTVGTRVDFQIDRYCEVV